MRKQLGRETRYIRTGLAVGIQPEPVDQVLAHRKPPATDGELQHAEAIAVPQNPHLSREVVRALIQRTHGHCKDP